MLTFYYFMKTAENKEHLEAVTSPGPCTCVDNVVIRRARLMFDIVHGNTSAYRVLNVRWSSTRKVRNLTASDLLRSPV